MAFIAILPVYEYTEAVQFYINNKQCTLRLYSRYNDHCLVSSPIVYLVAQLSQSIQQSVNIKAINIAHLSKLYDI